MHFLKTWERGKQGEQISSFKSGATAVWLLWFYSRTKVKVEQAHAKPREQADLPDSAGSATQNRNYKQKPLKDSR